MLMVAMDPDPHYVQCDTVAIRSEQLCGDVVLESVNIFIINENALKHMSSTETHYFPLVEECCYSL